MEADAVLAQLQVQEAQAKVPARPPDTTAPSALIHHLLDIHHAFTRSELARLDGLLARLQERHGDTQPELQELAACYQSLRDDLLPHLMKEETILFPYIEALERHREQATPKPSACFGALDNPLRQMGAEHAAVLSALERLRCLTNDYVPPAGVCTRYQIACQSLESLASDLLQHIHLENAVLFPQARESEAGL